MFPRHRYTKTEPALKAFDRFLIMKRHKRRLGEVNKDFVVSKQLPIIIIHELQAASAPTKNFEFKGHPNVKETVSPIPQDSDKKRKSCIESFQKRTKPFHPSTRHAKYAQVPSASRAPCHHPPTLKQQLP